MTSDPDPRWPMFSVPSPWAEVWAVGALTAPLWWLLAFYLFVYP